jgi:hypothetical protein
MYIVYVEKCRYEFWNRSSGMVYRPISSTAIKLPQITPVTEMQ